MPLDRRAIPLIIHNVRMFHEITLSMGNTVELMHHASTAMLWRPSIEQMALGANSNADFAKWASAMIREADERKRAIRMIRNPRGLVAIRTMENA